MYKCSSIMNTHAIKFKVFSFCAAVNARGGCNYLCTALRYSLTPLCTRRGLNVVVPKHDLFAIKPLTVRISRREEMS